MNTNIFGFVTDMGQKGVDVARVLTDVNNRVVSKVMDHQLKLVSQAMEQGIEQSQNLSHTDSIEKLVENQKDYFQANAKAGLESTRQWIEIVNESRDAYFSLLEETVAFAQPEKKAKSAKKAA